MAIKTTAVNKGEKCDVNIQDLYELVMQQGIPWNAWIEWLPSKIRNKK